MCRVGEEREGEVERLGVRRQETREQGSPSEWKKEKGKTQHYRASGEWEKSGVGYVVGSHKQCVEIVGVSSTIQMYLKFDQQKGSRDECLIFH